MLRPKQRVASPRHQRRPRALCGSQPDISCVASEGVGRPRRTPRPPPRSATTPRNYATPSRRQCARRQDHHRRRLKGRSAEIAGSATTPSNCATSSRRQGARRHDHHHRLPSSAPSGRRAAVRAQGPLAHRQLQPQQPPHPLPGEGRRHHCLSGNALGYWLASNFVPCHMLLQY